MTLKNVLNERNLKILVENMKNHCNAYLFSIRTNWEVLEDNLIIPRNFLLCDALLYHKRQTLT